MQWLEVVVSSTSGTIKVDDANAPAYCELRLDTGQQTGIERALPGSAAEAAERIIDWLGCEAG